MENNMAMICSVKNIRPIENRDKIVTADIMLQDIAIANVIVGKGQFKENDLVVYFDSNMCLSEAILKDYPDLSKYLAKNGRVKCIKLGGVISNGLTLHLNQIEKYTKDKSIFKEGYSFLELNGTSICHKYVPIINVQRNGTRKNSKDKKIRKISRMIEGQFHFHVDTDQLLRNAHRIKPDNIISISRKLHGTSCIVSNSLVKKKLSWMDKIAKFFGINVVETEYDIIYASRSVIKNGCFESGNKGFYKEDIWKVACDKFFKGNLVQGESVYFEIYGYLSSGAMIQKNYSYGCLPYNHNIGVYRITRTSPDGNVIELGWQAMKERCMEMNVPHVQEYYFGKASDLYDIPVDEDWTKNFVAKLQENYLEKNADDCGPNIPDEGIVVRVESKNIVVFKLKSLKFIKKESDNNEEGVADMEEEVSIEQEETNEQETKE